MSDDTQKQLISVIATAIAFVLASRLAENLVDQPERRGTGHYPKEGLLQGGVYPGWTGISSGLDRRGMGGRRDS